MDNKINDKLTNLDISKHYSNKEFWLLKKDFNAAFAYWVVAQSPYDAPDITEALNAFNAYISSKYGSHEVIKFSYGELKAIINEDEFVKIPAIEKLNHPKIDLGIEIMYVDRYRQPKPDYDFIDLGALARNIFYAILREKITTGEMEGDGNIPNIRIASGGNINVDHGEIEPKKVKLHLGCGKRFFGGDWIHIDAERYPHVIYHDVTKLQFADNSVDLIYACHLLEYFDREEAVDVLREWYRVLKSGSILRLAVPDFGIMARLYVEGKINLCDILGPLYGRMRSNKSLIYHKMAFDIKSLRSVLEAIGFKSIKCYDWRKTEHAEFDDCSQAYLLPRGDKENGVLISLNMDAVK